MYEHCESFQVKKTLLQMLIKREEKKSWKIGNSSRKDGNIWIKINGSK